MRFILILILLIGICGASDYYGDISMRSDANITFDDGYIIDAKMGESVHYVSVGPYDWCDYKTDGTADQVECESAMASLPAGRDYQATVVIYGNIYINETIDVPYHTKIILNAKIHNMGIQNGTSMISMGSYSTMIGGTLYAESAAIYGVQLSGQNSVLVQSNIQDVATYSQQSAFGVYVSGSYNSIEHCEMHNCTNGTTYGSAGYGIYITGSYNNILYNKITQSGTHGIGIDQGGDGNYINGNYVDTTYSGFGICASSWYIAYGTIISSNIIINTTLEAINIQNGSHTTIVNNICDGTPTSRDFGICVYDSQWSIVNGNSIRDFYKSGIAICESDNSCVVGNTVSNCGDSAANTNASVLLYCQDATDSSRFNVISNNIIVEESSPRQNAYGVQEDNSVGTCDYNYVHWNEIAGYLVADVAMTGGNSVEANNIDVFT